MVPFETLQVAQIQIANTQASVVVVARQLVQQSYNFFIRCIKFALVEVARLTDPKRLASHTKTNASLIDCFDCT